jgi:hypothetical protein
MGKMFGSILLAVPRGILRAGDRRRRRAQLRHQEMLATLRAGGHR